MMRQRILGILTLLLALFGIHSSLEYFTGEVSIPDGEENCRAICGLILLVDFVFGETAGKFAAGILWTGMSILLGVASLFMIFGKKIDGETSKMEGSALHFQPQTSTRLSWFTKLIIYIAGLPLASLIIAFIVSAVLRSFGIVSESSSIVLWIILLIWVVGAMLCKFIFFKTARSSDRFLD